jgi:hypothetical protein
MSRSSAPPTLELFVAGIAAQKQQAEKDQRRQ